MYRGRSRNVRQSPEENVCSVGELNAEIESVIAAAQDRFPSYVIGEISDINRYGISSF